MKVISQQLASGATVNLRKRAS